MATVVVNHTPSGGPADPTALVDGPTYDADPHIVTGLENVDNTADIDKPISNATLAAIRERLTAARIYYYRADGSDSNDGLTNSAGGAFLTAQKAYDTICDDIDLNGYDVGIYCGSAAGTVFTTGITASKFPVGNSGGAVIVWDGGDSIVRVTNGTCLDFGAGNGFGGYPQITIQNIRFETVTSGDCILARGGVILGGPGIVFGASAGHHVYGGHDGHFGLQYAYTIAGSPGAGRSHIYGYSNFLFWAESIVITISTSITVGTFVSLITGSLGLMDGATFVNSGNVTGTKFSLANSGTHLSTGTSGNLSFLPGTVAGSILPGATYDGVGGTEVSFSPTVTPDSGAYGATTAVTTYTIAGGVVHFYGTITFTTLGTGTGRANISLPVPTITAVRPYIGSAYNIDSATDPLASINIFGTSLTLSLAGGAPYAGAGNRVAFSISYPFA